eukprot:1551975-Alexandrium_andersonii.AAC.1
MGSGATGAQVVMLAGGDDAERGLVLVAESGELDLHDRRRGPEPIVLELGREDEALVDLVGARDVVDLLALDHRVRRRD